MNTPPIQPQSTPHKSDRAKFLTGSTMNHVVSMTMTGSVGLISMFAVDMVDIYFLSLLGDWSILAAMGYASAITYFTVALGLGLSITAVSFISRAVGGGDNTTADRLVTHMMVYVVVFMGVYALIIYPLLQDILYFVGAGGKVALLAQDYLEIMLPTAVFIALAITMSGVLRCFGDGRRGMYITLIGAGVNLVLDPIFIFGFGMGIEGAGTATALSRFAMVVVGAYCIIEIHGVKPRIIPKHIIPDAIKIARFSTITMATNLASPTGNTIILMWLSPYGDDVMTAWSVWGRLVPVFFGITFALSGAIGPIIGQNYGAGNMARVQGVIRDALLFSCAIVLTTSTIGVLVRYPLAELFSLNANSTAFFVFLLTYCSWLVLFNAFIFISNAIFNTLGVPHYSTLFSWARHIVGVVPFVMAGGYVYDAHGVVFFAGLGGVVFGIWAYKHATKYVNTV